MKRPIACLTAVILCIGSTQLHAQFGPPGGGMGGQSSGPSFGGDMAKLFGENQAFSANVEFQFKQGGSEDAMTLPAKVAYSEGKSRFDLDLTRMKGGGMPPDAGAQMKQMGLDKMVAISLPDKKVTRLIYPGLEAYVEMPMSDPDDFSSAADYKMEVTEVGKETFGGHDCIKNKVVVTGKDGTKHESTVWNASDLKKFPVKIETSEEGHDLVMLFKDVKLAKPPGSEFDPPTGYTKYDSMMTMMQQVMMKRMGGAGMGTPPGN